MEQMDEIMEHVPIRLWLTFYITMLLHCIVKKIYDDINIVVTYGVGYGVNITLTPP